MDIEAHRLEGRTKFDLEMLNEIGSCKGVENYSRHFDRRKKESALIVSWISSLTMQRSSGDADRYLVIMDESHVTLPQVGGMYGGDFSRKKNLVDHGLDFLLRMTTDHSESTSFRSWFLRWYVSATPGERELRHLLR